jgi:hypothetical protein
VGVFKYSMKPCLLSLLVFFPCPDSSSHSTYCDTYCKTQPEQTPFRRIESETGVSNP